jgi:hypothetical protein
MLRTPSTNDQSATGVLTTSPASQKPISPRRMRTTALARVLGAEGEARTIAKFRANRTAASTKTISPAILHLFIGFPQRNVLARVTHAEVSAAYNNR